MSNITRASSAVELTFLILLGLCVIVLGGLTVIVVGMAMYKLGVLFYILGIFGGIFLLWCAVYGYFFMTPSKHVTEKDI